MNKHTISVKLHPATHTLHLLAHRRLLASRGGVLTVLSAVPVVALTGAALRLGTELVATGAGSPRTERVTAGSERVHVRRVACGASGAGLTADTGEVAARALVVPACVEVVAPVLALLLAATSGICAPGRGIGGARPLVLGPLLVVVTSCSGGTQVSTMNWVTMIRSVPV